MHARRHIARCAQYGRPAYGLIVAAWVPAPLRRVAVTMVESCRRIYWSALRYSPVGLPAVNELAAFVDGIAVTAS